MNVLVLVLSCLRPPYDVLDAVQRRTWKTQVSGALDYWCDDLRLAPGCLRRALGEVLADPSWTHLFRTNASSYVDVRRLGRFAAQMPSERCYAGLDGGGFASGSGFLLSRDVAEVLRDELPDASDVIEDRLIGEILARRGIGVTPGASRVDYWLEENLCCVFGATRRAEMERMIRDAYHVRCKGAEGGDRALDEQAMETVHAIKSR